MKLYKTIREDWLFLKYISAQKNSHEFAGYKKADSWETLLTANCFKPVEQQ